MSRAYCRCCGDILDDDRIAGNARPGADYCDACCVTLREDDAQRWAADNDTNDNAPETAEMGR